MTLTPGHLPTPDDMRPYRLMIVDDTPENLTLLKNMLVRDDVDIFAFPSGPLALRAAVRTPPDLVLLDINMPGMDGYEVCERFRQDPMLSEVPVIFLTALADTDSKLRGFAAGAVDYVTKPFQIEEVQARVRTQLELCRLRKQLKDRNRYLQEQVDLKVRELTEAHERSRQLLAEVAHMNRNLTSSVYSAAIAHDLRQPLAAILANVEAAQMFLAKDPPDLAEIADILDDIRRDDLRADQIIQSMRKMLNKTNTELDDIEINDIADKATGFLAPEARTRDVSLELDLAPGSFTVRGDRTQIQQVLVNLMINGMDAMAATPAGRRRLLVRTRARDGNTVQVTVSDRGTGFRDVAQAFQSFVTTKAHGLGLGLSISSSLVRAHGGELRAENNPEGGASVHFWLPLLP